MSAEFKREELTLAWFCYRYDGFWDAARKTYRSEGFVGFYRGLVPTLAKGES
jgi:Mitochondrial carrier protein